MASVTLSAHFDGKNIQLDEPYDLPTNSRLMVVVIPSEDEHTVWTRASAAHLANAYGNDEPEYTAADVKHE